MVDKIMARRVKYYRLEYGADFNALVERLEASGGCCEICSKPITFLGSKVTARLDHCHETGNIRGIICNRCNQALGMFGDNVEGIHRLLKYLEQ